MYVCTYAFMYVCMYVCMYLCIYVCMYACMYLCIYVCMYVPMHLCMYVCMHVCTYAFMCVCMYLCIYVCMYVCMHACMYVATHLCVYVCTYACMYVCTYVWKKNIYIHTYMLLDNFENIKEFFKCWCTKIGGHAVQKHVPTFKLLSWTHPSLQPKPITKKKPHQNRCWNWCLLFHTHSCHLCVKFTFTCCSFTWEI